MKTENKILVAGICWISELIRCRIEEYGRFHTTYKEYDVNKIKLINDSKIILATPYAKRRLDLKTSTNEEKQTIKFNDFAELLTTYKDCLSQYFIFTWYIPKSWTTTGKEVYGPVTNSFWYFVYDELKSTNELNEIQKLRNKAIDLALKHSPKLKFICHEEYALKFYLENGFPKNRMLYWPMKRVFGGGKNFHENKLESSKLSHDYPTEDSYNELYSIITEDVYQETKYQI